MNIIHKSKMIQSVVNIAMHSDDNAVLGPALETIREWILSADSGYSQYSTRHIRKELIEFGTLRAYKRILTAESSDSDVKLRVFYGLRIIAAWCFDDDDYTAEDDDSEDDDREKWYFINALIECGIIPTVIEMIHFGVANKDADDAFWCFEILKTLAKASDGHMTEYLVQNGSISALRIYDYNDEEHGYHEAVADELECAYAARIAEE